MSAATDETLQYMHFPREHWIRIRTNNPLERIMREIKRRTKVVGSFPDGQSALMLAAARFATSWARKWSTQRYLNTDLLKEEAERSVRGQPVRTRLQQSAQDS